MLSLEDLKQLNIISYHKHLWKNYGIIKEYSNWLSGLNCCLFNYKNTIVICFVGTKSLQDFCNDMGMLAGIIPAQAKQGLKILHEIKKTYSNVLLTGHSLGASVVQYIASQHNNKCICFSPFGTRLFNSHTCNNVINYGMESDIIYMSNLENQIGQIYLIENPKNKYHFIKDGKINYSLLANKSLRLNIGITGHSLEQYNNFNKALQVDMRLLQKYMVQNYCRTGLIQK